MKRALIISDGKPGHFNQSIAFCTHMELEFEIVDVAYRNRAAKGLSYALDRMGLYINTLYADSGFCNPASGFDLVVSTGSSTYYANKLLAKKLRIPNIAILLPNGYRLDFSHIFCPAYDHPPQRGNIAALPINLCAADSGFFDGKASEFKNRHSAKKPSAGIIIGGPNAVSDLDPAGIRQQLERIFELTEGLERWVTTSRRTPKEIEAMVEKIPFDYRLINSRDSYNPVPAFIQLCDRIFVTSDSASMMSECASFGSAKVEILKTTQLKSPNKFEELVAGLELAGAAHVFDGTLGVADRKIDIAPLIKNAMARLTNG